MSTHASSCFCIGPQNGQPLCPCQMRSVTQVDGRWVRTQDLGPVNSYESMMKDYEEESSKILEDYHYYKPDKILA